MKKYIMSYVMFFSGELRYNVVVSGYDEGDALVRMSVMADNNELLGGNNLKNQIDTDSFKLEREFAI